MNWKQFSVIAYLGAVICLLWMAYQHALFGTGPITISIQVAAALLMLWARLTFGLRSFHASANPTQGGLVTRGPYRFVRHPIYAAVLYFLWAGVSAHPGPVNLPAAVLASALLGVRMFAEERLLLGRYPEYADYARRTRRVVPFVL
jgi:protein-S-isoprenylcysteine O-methyltransferase Ste14